MLLIVRRCRSSGVTRRLERTHLFGRPANHTGPCISPRSRSAPGSVVAGDVDPLAPAFTKADHSELMPRLDSPEYSSRLLELCQRRQIALVVPTIDTELALLAGLSDEFARSGITILVSATKLIEATSDKRKTEGLQCSRHPHSSWMPGISERICQNSCSSNPIEEAPASRPISCRVNRLKRSCRW